jgi:hypothetical protein
MHSVPVPTNVRCYSNSDIIVRRSEVTIRARKRHAPGERASHQSNLSPYKNRANDVPSVANTCYAYELGTVASHRSDRTSMFPFAVQA